MSDLFRLKIASKRQMTAPQRLLDVLGLNEGDEIRIEVADGQIVRTEACKVLPTRLFSPEILKKLAQREAEPMDGATTINPESLMTEERMREERSDKARPAKSMAQAAAAVSKGKASSAEKNIRSAS